VILLGGGLDSGALLYWLKASGAWIEALWIDYGQKAAFGESVAVGGLCYGLNVPVHRATIDLGDLSQCALLRGQRTNSKNASRKNKLEARNVVFVGLAAMLASSLGLPRVYVGFHQEPAAAPFPDATEDARWMMNELLNFICRPAVSLVAPFKDLSRQEILEAGLKLNPNLASDTFTCYESTTDAECGQCAHCQRKARMLKRVKARTGPECAPPEAHSKRDLLRRRKLAQKQPSV